MRQQALFNQGRLVDYLDERRVRAKQAARELPEARLRDMGFEAAAAAVTAEFRVDPLHISFAEKQRTEPTEIDLDVSRDPRYAQPRRAFARGKRSPMTAPGMRHVIHLPFDGDPKLFELQPNLQTNMRPHANVNVPQRRLEVDIEVASVDDAAAVIKAQLDQEVDLLTTYASAQMGPIEEFNARLLQETRQVLEARLTHLDATKAAVSTIGIPLVPRAGAPRLPIVLDQKIEIHRASATDSDSARAVPTIRDGDYDNILSLIRHQCRTFEGAPVAFGALDEEHLRDVIRACLCAVYQGAAAEAFRSKGKTDICIEAEDRSAFVTECKIWSGGKALVEALDQLLSYLIWRDCKAALVVFNKTVQRFGELAGGKVIQQIQSHQGYVRTALSNAKDGEWRVVLRHSDGHEVLCHVMLYNLFSR